MCTWILKHYGHSSTAPLPALGTHRTVPGPPHQPTSLLADRRESPALPSAAFPGGRAAGPGAPAGSRADLRPFPARPGPSVFLAVQRTCWTVGAKALLPPSPAPVCRASVLREQQRGPPRGSPVCRGRQLQPRNRPSPSRCFVLNRPLSSPMAAEGHHRGLGHNRPMSRSLRSD